MGDYVNIIHPHVHSHIVRIKSVPKVHVFGLWENIIHQRILHTGITRTWKLHIKTRNLNQNLLPMTLMQQRSYFLKLFIHVSIYLIWIITFHYLLMLCFLGFLAHLGLRTQANKTTTGVLREEVRVHLDNSPEHCRANKQIHCYLHYRQKVSTYNTSLM